MAFILLMLFNLNKFFELELKNNRCGTKEVCRYYKFVSLKATIKKAAKV